MMQFPKLKFDGASEKTISTFANAAQEILDERSNRAIHGFLCHELSYKMRGVHSHNEWIDDAIIERTEEILAVVNLNEDRKHVLRMVTGAFRSRTGVESLLNLIGMTRPKTGLPINVLEEMLDAVSDIKEELAACYRDGYVSIVLSNHVGFKALREQFEFRSAQWINPTVREYGAADVYNFRYMWLQDILATARGV